MRIAIVTDAWEPQVNGVVTTLSRTRDNLRELGHIVKMFTPQGFRSIPCPTYSEIRLSLFPKGRLNRKLGCIPTGLRSYRDGRPARSGRKNNVHT